MEEPSKKSDKYDETFESVLSAADSEFQLNSESKNMPVPTTKMAIKRRNKDLEKTNFKSKSGAKKKRETAKDRMIKMNSFYSSNTFGIWIQCTKCDKWRKVMEYEEEHEVPEDWCCSMSISGIRSCDEPEDLKDAVFSPVSFIPGAIVWAKYNGYPWWPGMIEDDPDIEEYYWIEKGGKCGYHVTFLDDKVTRAWVPASFVRHYLDPPRYRYLNARYSKYSPLIAEAEIKAKKAINMPIQQRLENFSFAHRYRGKWGSPLRCDNSDENEGERDLTQMLLEEVNDIESTKSTDSDYKSVSSFELKKNEIDKESDCKISSKDNPINNVECKKNQVNRNKLPSKKQLKKENKSLNEDDTADLKVKPLNKQTGEKKLHLDEVMPNSTETDDLKSLISQKTKEVKLTHSESIRRKSLTANKDISTSVETPPEDCLTTGDSKSKKSNTLMKISKIVNKADKLKNLDETICRAKRDEEETKPSSVKRHIENSKITNSVKKENSGEKALNNSVNSKFKPPLKNNKSYASENNQINERMDDEETTANKNLSNTDSTIKEQRHDENEMVENYLEENKQLTETSNTKCSLMKKRSSKNGNKTENDKTSKENLKSQNKLKNNVVNVLKKNLKSSLVNKSVSLKESRNHTSNDSSTIFLEISTPEDKKQESKTNEKSNHTENLTCSEARDSGPNRIKRSKVTATSIMQQKGKIMKVDSLRQNLPVSVIENSKLMGASKFTTKQTTSKKEKKNLKTDEIKCEKEEMKQKQDNEIICISDGDDMLQQTSYNEDANKENFSLSVKMNLQESEEEDSDPFEAE